MVGEKAIDGADNRFGDEPPGSLAAYARSIVRKRARVERYMNPGLFGDPAFDILLDLYASEVEGNVVYVTSSADVTRLPLSTVMRYIVLLEREGLIDRTTDVADKRLVVVAFTNKGRAAMTNCLADIAPYPIKP